MKVSSWLSIIFFMLIHLSLYGQGSITSVTHHGPYDDFDAVVVDLTANANYNAFFYVSYEPQKWESNQWISLNAWDYVPAIYSSGSWSVTNKSVNIFRGEDYYGNFARLHIDPAGDGTYRIEFKMWVDFDPAVTEYSNSFTVTDIVAPSAPTGITRSIVGSQNNPRIDWDQNPEGDIKNYEVYKKVGNNPWGSTPIVTLSNTIYSYVDQSVTGASFYQYSNNVEISYRVKAVDFNSNESANSSSVSFNVPGGDMDKTGGSNPVAHTIPDHLVLLQNYPNPFNPTTIIQFDLEGAGPVEVTVYSLNGQKIATLANEFMEAGFHQVKWNGKDLQDNPVSSGMYLYQLKAGDQRLVKKMMLIK